MVKLVFGDADRETGGSKSVFRNNAIFGFTDKKTNGRVVRWMFNVAVDSSDIECELPQVFRTEGLHLEFDDDIASELEMVEKKVCVEILLPDGESVLLTYISKAIPEFK